ncbi:hypothetical protein LTR94_006211 [Friedmanniomyces endolithicus]|nr:hypothetical protein LTR94_006211 [Friedmanniomyces endolithicus]
MEVATTTIDEPKKPRLLSIPPEVRQNIYDHTVPASNVIPSRAEEIAETSTSSALIRFHPRLPLAYVCHQIHDEYLAYFYKKNTIYFTDNVMRTHILDAFVARYGEEANLIKSVKVYAKLERKYPSGVPESLPTIRRFPFEIRFQMGERAGAVAVHDLKTTEYMDARDGKMRGFCCCYLSEMAESGMSRVGGLVGILRAFLGAATLRNGSLNREVEICGSCGNYKPSLAKMLTLNRSQDHDGVSAGANVG